MDLIFKFYFVCVCVHTGTLMNVIVYIGVCCAGRGQRTIWQESLVSNHIDSME